jgi:hypothetical protein
MILPKILNIKLFSFIFFFVLFYTLNCLSSEMDQKPYHHLPDGTFRNPEGSPVRSENVKFSYSQFTKEKKKLI